MSEGNQLPAPHASISVSVEWFGSGATIEYEGPDLQALLAAGCIDQATYNEYNANPRRRLCLWPSHECWRSKLYYGRRSGARIKIKHTIWDDAKARSMPGVADYSRESAAFQDDSTRALVHLAMAQRETEGLIKKQRAVGRFQRLVEYATCENLIVPNWTALVRARLA
jgi:hypothetical protein